MDKYIVETIAAQSDVRSVIRRSSITAAKAHINPYGKGRCMSAMVYNAELGSVSLSLSMTPVLVELLHLCYDLLKTGQPFVELLLDFGFRFTQLWVECSPVGACIHRELLNEHDNDERGGHNQH